jgi:flagellar FliL protein
MSEQAATRPEATEAAKPAGRSSWLLRACVLAFMLVVILGECLVAYRYLRSSETPAKDTGAHEHEAEPKHDAEDKHGHDAEAKDEHEKEKSHDDKSHEAEKGHGGTQGSHGEHGKTGQSPQIEMDMGDFSVTIFQPASNTTLRIDFHLFGAIRADDEGEFKNRIEEHKHRFRDQVLVTIRSSDVADLADPGLGLIKRKILAKTNETLGKPLVRSVIFSEFSFVEQ